MSRITYVWDKATGELVLKSEHRPFVPDAPVVHGDIEDFVSPITKEVIHDRGQLRRHNKRHGVTDSRDYSPEYIAKRSNERDDRMTGNTKAARAERVEIINRELKRHGV